jgi:AcrR family transcriptional regulator
MVGTTPIAALLDEDPDLDPYADRILDAAIEQFARHGIRRTSVDDVAGAAKVGRVIVYRRFATKDQLVRAAWIRHLRRIHATLSAATEGLVDPLERVIEWFALGVHALRDDPLFRRLLMSDRDTVLPYLSVDAAPIHAATTTIVLDDQPGLRAMLGDHAERVTELFVRLGGSLVVSPGGFTDTGDINQTRSLARQLIEPVLHAIEQQGESHV